MVPTVSGERPKHLLDLGLKSELGDIVFGEIKIIVQRENNFIPLEFFCHQHSPDHRGFFFTQGKLRQSIIFYSVNENG